MGGGEPNLSDECLRAHRAEVVAKCESGELFCNGCAVSGDNGGPVLFWGRYTGVGGGIGGFGGLAALLEAPLVQVCWGATGDCGGGQGSPEGPRRRSGLAREVVWGGVGWGTGGY